MNQATRAYGVWGAAGIRLAEVDVIAINQDTGANLWKKLACTVMRRPDRSLVLDRIRNKRRRVGVAGELARIFPGERLRAAVREVDLYDAYVAHRRRNEPRESPAPRPVAVL